MPFNNSSLAATDIFGQTTTVSELTEMPVLFQSSTLSASSLLSNVLAGLPNLNLPPVPATLSNQSVQHGQSLQFSVQATDPNNNPFVFSANSLPAGASFNPTNGVFSWIPAADQVGTYPITFTITDDQGMSATVSTTIQVTDSLLDQLIHYWTLGDGSGTTVSDSAGACPGSLIGFSFNASDGWTSGVNGIALAFDGVKDSVVLGTNNLILTNNFSVSAWLKPGNATAAGAFLSLHSNYGSSGMRLFINDNKITVQAKTTAGWQDNSFAAGAIQSGVWYHILVVYDKSTVTVYLDGVSQGSLFYGGDVVMNPLWQSFIGTEGNYFFNGTIQDVMIFNRTLSSQEAMELYQAPSQPPTFTAIGAQNVQPGQTLSFTVSATDTNDIPLGYSASPLPSDASFDPATGLFTWTPDSSQLGDYTATFTASNGLVSSAEKVSISVTTTPPPVDTTPPTLMVVSPADDQIFTNAGISVSGTTSDASGIRAVTVNGAGATLNNANWSLPVTLSPGTNSLQVIATDASPNLNTATQIVYAVYNPSAAIPAPVITASPSVSNAMLQVGNMAVVVAGDPVVLSVGAMDPNRQALNYTWAFGDGGGSGPSSASTAGYAYAGACGPYTGSVVVDDGTYSNRAGFTVSVACQLQSPKLQGSLNFARTNADSCVLQGKLDLPADYAFSGKQVTAYVGGEVASFTLNNKGQAHASSLVFNKPVYSRKTGLWTFNLTLKNRDLQTAWASYGMLNQNVPSPGTLIDELPAILVIDDQSFMETMNVHYIARQSKSATIK